MGNSSGYLGWHVLMVPPIGDRSWPRWSWSIGGWDVVLRMYILPTRQLLNETWRNDGETPNMRLDERFAILWFQDVGFLDHEMRKQMLRSFPDTSVIYFSMWYFLLSQVLWLAGNQLRSLEGLVLPKLSELNVARGRVKSLVDFDWVASNIFRPHAFQSLIIIICFLWVHQANDSTGWM